MNGELKKASELLKGEGYTAVLCLDEVRYTTRERGIKPLMKWLSDGLAVDGFYAADKIVGKAPALLYVLLRVKGVYSPVMSEAAVQVLSEHGIAAEYDTLVTEIRNRSDTGCCPMEEAVAGITEPSDAPGAIQRKLAEIRK